MTEQSYLSLIKNILENGIDRSDRTNTGTRGLFGCNLRFDLAAGFPLLTTKRMELKSVLSELLWFIEGSGDERRLAEIRYQKPRDELTNKKTIWSGNADAPYWINHAKYPGDLGRPYGVQLRDWTNQYGEKLDQLAVLVDGLKSDPYSRRHCVTWWNPGELRYMALPACHQIAHFYVAQDRLSCMFTMRSTDVALGLPYNIASYALFTHMLANECGYGVGELVFSGADVHLYHNHIAGVTEQLSRSPFSFPTLVLKNKNISDYQMSDFVLNNYTSHPSIAMEMAV